MGVAEMLRAGVLIHRGLLVRRSEMIVDFAVIYDAHDTA